MTQHVDPNNLREALIEYYNTGELRTLCFELSIDYESLGGRGKAEKVAELVLYARRNNRLNEIASYVRRTRPFIQLKMRDTQPPPLDEASGSEGAVTHITHIHGDMVGGDKVGGDKVGGDNITVGDVSGSGVAIGRGASSKVETGPAYNFSGSVVGSTIGGGKVYAENIAGGDININANPQNKAEFSETLNALKKLLQEAIANSEFEDERDGEDSLKEIQEITEETKSEKPRARSIKRSLGNLSDILGGAGKVAEAAGKAGTAVLKVTPIIAGLLKAASLIF